MTSDFHRTAVTIMEKILTSTLGKNLTLGIYQQMGLSIANEKKKKWLAQEEENRKAS
jgi:hypothetical protein